MVREPSRRGAGRDGCRRDAAADSGLAGSDRAGQQPDAARLDEVPEVRVGLAVRAADSNSSSVARSFLKGSRGKAKCRSVPRQSR